MLQYIILSILIGILFGTFTGLIPGIHINLIGVFLISLSSTLFLNINPIYLIVFITALAITHTFIDFIPSVFLGCPDTDTELAILPAHQMLKEGNGYQAIMLTAFGSLAAILILILIAYPSVLIFPKIFTLTKNILPYILIATSIILISLEKNKSTAIKIFLLTGVLGWCILNLEQLKEPLLPLLTGLFGSSMLLTTIKTKTKIPEQEIIKPKTSYKPLLGAILASPLCSFLPGLGSGQATIIGQTITKRKDPKDFLILLGATNTLVMGFSFITLYLLAKTRTGAANAIKQIMGQPTTPALILILITVIITGLIAFQLTKYLSIFFSKRINKMDYTKLSMGTLILLVITVTLVSGFLGLLVLIVTTFTGIYCISQNVRRTQMMGCLLIPTVLLYFGL